MKNQKNITFKKNDCNVIKCEMMPHKHERSHNYKDMRLIWNWNSSAESTAPYWDGTGSKDKKIKQEV